MCRPVVLSRIEVCHYGWWQAQERPLFLKFECLQGHIACIFRVNSVHIILSTIIMNLVGNKDF